MLWYDFRRPWHDLTCDNHVIYLSAYQYLGIRRGHHQKTTPKSGSCSPHVAGSQGEYDGFLADAFSLGVVVYVTVSEMIDPRRRRFTTIGKYDDGEDDDSNDEDDHLQWCLHNIDTKSFTTINRGRAPMESKASHQSFAVESWKRHTTGIYISQHGKVKNPLFNIYIVYATSMWGGNLKLRYNVCIILFNLLQLSFNHHFSAFWTTICKGHGLGKLSMAINEAWPISRFRLGLLFGNSASWGDGTEIWDGWVMRCAKLLVEIL